MQVTSSTTSPTCPFGTHQAHFEMTLDAFGQALLETAWPETNDFVPPGNVATATTWRNFYQVRLQIGLISLYPRTLTAPLPWFALNPAPPQRLLEILLVPHWSHITPLRAGVYTRQDRLAATTYACCELAGLYQAVLQLWPKHPPVFYAITHHGLREFFKHSGYTCIPLPKNLGKVYRPAIDRLIQRDDPHRGQSQALTFAYLPNQPEQVSQAEKLLRSASQRAEQALQKWSL